MSGDLISIEEGGGPRDRHVAVRIQAANKTAASITLYVYADEPTLEVFAGEGTSFLFERLDLTGSHRRSCYRDARRIVDAVIAGGLTETRTTAGGSLVSIEGRVELADGSTESSAHIVQGRAPRTAGVTTTSYRPY